MEMIKAGLVSFTTLLNHMHEIKKKKIFNWNEFLVDVNHTVSITILDSASTKNGLFYLKS